MRKMSEKDKQPDGQEKEKDKKHQISITHKAKLLLFEEMAMKETYSKVIIRIMGQLAHYRVLYGDLESYRNE